MQKRVIFGNSGSGKSTLAKSLSEKYQLTHLDLDTIAWQPIAPPQRLPLEASLSQLSAFDAGHTSWVIEGCYADLIEAALASAEQLIFLDLPVSVCQQNACNRPWELHKYSSPAAQNANLAMLLDWIANYERRDDEFSRAAHQALFARFEGDKIRVEDNFGAAQLVDLL